MEKPLSPRQCEVLRLMIRGWSRRHVARELGISVHTVDTHLRNAYARLHARTLRMAAVKAIHRGELDIEDLVA